MLNAHLAKQLATFKEESLLRQRYTIEQYDEGRSNVIYINNKKLINFSHNDYLHLKSHPKIKEAFKKGIDKYGLGSGAASLVSGFHGAHQLLEEALADFLKRERALLFGSGYLANIGIIPTLAKKNTTIIADKLCHASLLDGILLSRAKYKRFPHQNFSVLKSLLDHIPDEKIMVTEGVFSMEGDITPLPSFVKLCRQYNAFSVLDDAHGLGVLGKKGRGTMEHFHLKANEIDLLITPFGKALGSMGAVVSGEAHLIEAILQLSKSYRYSTALPPALSFATLTALELLKNEHWRRERLNELIQFLIIEADKRQLPLISRDLTPIKSILIKDNKLCLAIKSFLYDLGFFVSCIRPPTVPKASSRIRLSINCLHEKKDIIALLDAISHAT